MSLFLLWLWLCDCTHAKTHRILHLKRLNLTIYELYMTFEKVASYLKLHLDFFF